MAQQDTTNPFARRSLSAAISAVVAGAAPAVQAQDDDDRMVEEIIVTATKRQANLQDIPMSVQAFTSDDIVRQGFKKLDDYIGQVPGLSYGRREPGGTNVIMRGCAVSGIAFSDNPTTAVYLDEQPITVAGFNPDPRLVDIERVEALSGPQGSLFGDASQCGTLRIITNKPKVTAFDSWVDLTGSTVKDGDFGYDVAAMVNIPLSNNSAALRFVGFHAEDAGYVDNILGLSPGGPFFPGGSFDNAEFVEDDVNTTEVSGFRAGLRFLPNDDWVVDLQAIYQNVEADGFGDVDLTENFMSNTRIGEWEQVRFGQEFWEDEWYQLALTAEANLGWADLTVATSFMNRKTRYDADSTAYLAAWQELYPYYNIYDFGGDPRAQSTDKGETDRFSAEIRLATPSDSTSRWSGLVGLFYNKVESYTLFTANVQDLRYSNAFYYLNYSAFYYNPSAPPSDNWWTGTYDTELEQMALFGEATFEVTDRFSLTAGGRYFKIDNDFLLSNGTLITGVNNFRVQGPALDCTPLASPPPETPDLCWTGPAALATSSESDFVPTVTAAFDITDDKMVYATYSEGFRRGGANSARPTSIFGRPPFNEYESDVVENFEIGAKTTWAGGRFRANITAYFMDWNDIQIEVEDPTPNTFTLGIVNFPAAEINGVEGFFDWTIADGWNLTANIGYNDATLSSGGTISVGSTDTVRSARAGAQLPLVPDWKSSFVLEHGIDRTLWGARPSWALTYSYTGESNSSLGGIQSIEFNNPVRVQDSYTIVDLRFTLDGPDWSASLFIDNLTDEYAEQFFNDRWAQTRLSVNRPRTIGINYRKYFH